MEENYRKASFQNGQNKTDTEYGIMSSPVEAIKTNHSVTKAIIELNLDFCKMQITQNGSTCLARLGRNNVKSRLKF